MTVLLEIDSLTATVIVDNEVDPLSTIAADTVEVSGLMPQIAMRSKVSVPERGGATKEIKMEDVCCGHHGLSILLTATRGDLKHTLLFDTGPEEDNWERNARVLSPDLGSVEVIQLSHWHRDHSGGMLRAIRMIKDAKKAKGVEASGLVVDLHPDRPDYRGLKPGDATFSLPADPSFQEIKVAGATVETSTETHVVLDNMFLISGEIPRLTLYENGIKHGVRYIGSENKWIEDELILDERFLMCNVKGKGIIVFTGCSHAGVVNTTKHAIETLESKVPLYAVVGGFHLAGSSKEDISATVRTLKEMDPKVLLPGHCSGWRVKYEIEKEMPGRLVPCTVGITIAF